MHQGHENSGVSSLRKLAADETVEEILKTYPQLKAEHLKAAFSTRLTYKRRDCIDASVKLLLDENLPQKDD